MRNVSSVLLAAFVLALATPAAAQDHAAGKRVYADNKCSMCHSIGGVGNKKFPLDDTGKMKAEDIRAWLVDAKAQAEKEGKKMAMPMKSFKALPAGDLEALVAYLQSLKQ
jgi:mono/diheme cytochrome c family protein